MVINYRLRVSEDLRKAFYMHHVLDILLNLLIPVNNIYNGIRSIDDITDLSLYYLDNLYMTIHRSIPEPNDGFIIGYDSIRRYAC